MLQCFHVKSFPLEITPPACLPPSPSAVRAFSNYAEYGWIFFFNKYLIMLKLCFQVWVAMIVFLRKFVKFWEALYNSEAWPVPLTSEVIWGSDINSQLFKWLWDTERRLSAEVQSSGVLLTFYKTLSEKFPKNGKRSQITCHLIHFTQLPAVSKHGWFSQRARRNKIRVPSDPSRLLTKVQSHTNSTVNM